MNHYKNTTLAIAAIVAAVAMTAAAFAIPQQALAYGHHNHNHHGNSIKVSQDISQVNVCTNFTDCLNDANNSADIHR
jgi:hypothetical protein